MLTCGMTHRGGVRQYAMPLATCLYSLGRNLGEMHRRTPLDGGNDQGSGSMAREDRGKEGERVKCKHSNVEADPRMVKKQPVSQSVAWNSRARAEGAVRLV